MIIIPMAGLSSRFFKAGYKLPKYQLMLNGKSVFARSLLSFEKYFDNEIFLIIVRDVYDTKAFVEQELQQLGIKDYYICVLDFETEGQAHTVYLGLQDFKKALRKEKINEPLYIFNIDTFRHDFEKPEIAKTCDGYLEVFKGEGEHWSFIAIDEQDNVIQTTEKHRISELCSDGLYYFQSAEIFQQVFEYAKSQQMYIKGELYIAPLYNLMIEQGMKIGYILIDLNQIDFCGTPAEYQQLIELNHNLR